MGNPPQLGHQAGCLARWPPEPLENRKYWKSYTVGRSRMRVYGLYEPAHVYTVSPTKKRTSELFSATLTPQRENQAEQCSYTIWGGQLGSSDLSCLQSILVLRIVGYWAIPVSIGSLLALAILSALLLCFGVVRSAVSGVGTTFWFYICMPCYLGSG